LLSRFHIRLDVWGQHEGQVFPQGNVIGDAQFWANILVKPLVAQTGTEAVVLFNYRLSVSGGTITKPRMEAVDVHVHRAALGPKIPIPQAFDDRRPIEHLARIGYRGQQPQITTCSLLRRPSLSGSRLQGPIREMHIATMTQFLE
jgi:hypothetical protein